MHFRSKRPRGRRKRGGAEAAERSERDSFVIADVKQCRVCLFFLAELRTGTFLQFIFWCTVRIYSMVCQYHLNQGFVGNEEEAAAPFVKKQEGRQKDPKGG